MKDPLTELFEDAEGMLKKVYADFMKIYEREDKSENSTEEMDDSKEEN
jgi:hypothetical protein